MSNERENNRKSNNSNTQFTATNGSKQTSFDSNSNKINSMISGVQTSNNKSLKTGSFSETSKTTKNISNNDKQKEMAKNILENMENNNFKATKSTIRNFPRTKTFLGHGNKRTLLLVKRNATDIIKNKSNDLSKDDDLGTSTIGYSVKAPLKLKTTINRTVQTTTILNDLKKNKKIKTSSNLNIGKERKKGYKFIKNKGLRKSWKHFQSKTRKKVAKKTATTIGNKVFISLTGKSLFPIIAIVLLFGIIVLAIVAPIIYIGGIFGGGFSFKDTGESIEIDEYLEETIPNKKEELKNEIIQKINEAKTSYHVIRIGDHMIGDDISSKIDSFMPSDVELCGMIKPLLQTILLMNYDNNPSKQECTDTINHIFSQIFSVKQFDTLEYCGQDLDTGEGDINYCDSCGEIHALPSCPNRSETCYHDSYTCDKCCHENIETEEQEEHPICSGYENCNGHNVLTIKINCDGVYGLVDEYFLEPIENLENNPSRTKEEDEQLIKTKEFYELFEEMAKMFGLGSISTNDLSGVNWINGTRTGSTMVVEFAKQFCGQIGGKPFWSWMGFSSRIEWCACFVYFVMENSGCGDSFPSSSNYAYCPSMVEAFSSVNRFAKGNFTDIVPGDVIYFDWNNDNTCDHTGIVIGRDETKVYTIEGNSGDMCKIKSYDLTSSCIYGYGLMNY